MEINDYLAGIAGIFFIYVIVWYTTINDWVPREFLTPVSQLLGLVAIVYTAIFVVDQLKEW